MQRQVTLEQPHTGTLTPLALEYMEGKLLNEMHLIGRSDSCHCRCGQSRHFHSQAECWGTAGLPKRGCSGFLVHFTLQHKAAEYETLLSKQ